MKLLVTHPGRQHVQHLLRALDEHGHSFSFWTGVPSASPDTAGPLYKAVAALSPQPTFDYPASRVDHCYIAPFMRRIADTVFPASKAVSLGHRGDNWFDRWCAARLDNVDAAAVICYENAALHTFRAARERGMTTILDAASFHHKWQDRHYDYPESDAAHARITAHKDKEIAAANHVLTVSELARESYIEAGVPPGKINSLSMGADIEVFSDTSEFSMKGQFTFVFAGYARPLKGIDLLLEASEQMTHLGLSHRLVFAGNIDSKYACRLGKFDHVRKLGHLSHEQLNECFASADCLVLPSLFDSFGRVVVEAMASGLPAIVGSNVGAKECINEGVNGWVVQSGSEESLLERMAWCVRNRETVASMRSEARASAEEYSWASYRDKAVDLLTNLLDEG